jgi:hypothetical protein
VKDGKKRNKIDSLRREISRTFSTINQRNQEIWGWIGFLKKFLIRMFRVRNL